MLQGRTCGGSAGRQPSSGRWRARIAPPCVEHWSPERVLALLPDHCTHLPILKSLTSLLNFRTGTGEDSAAASKRGRGNPLDIDGNEVGREFSICGRLCLRAFPHTQSSFRARHSSKASAISTSCGPRLTLGSSCSAKTSSRSRCGPGTVHLSCSAVDSKLTSSRHPCQDQNAG